MSRRAVWIAVVCLLALAVAATVSRRVPVREEQAAGTIVSLAPSVTETVFALGLGDRLIGVSTACDYPPEARDIRKVGDFAAPKIELIDALKPALVITTGLRDPEMAKAIERTGARLLRVEQRNLDDVVGAVEIIGRAAGVPARARELADEMRRRIARATAHVSERDRPRVFVELSEQPLSTGAKGSFLDELITRAGGSNIAHDLPQPWTTISADAVIARDPDIIIVGHPLAGDARAAVGGRVGWAHVSAVTTGHVVADLNPDLYQRPGPRMVGGLEAFAQLFGGFRGRGTQFARPTASPAPLIRGIVAGLAVVAAVIIGLVTWFVRRRRRTGADRRLVVGVTVLLAALVCAFFWALAAGDAAVPIGSLFDAKYAALVESRAARALLAMVVGAGLAVAGLILQGVLRNPLADPYVLGVSSGAALGAAGAILTGAVVVGTWTVPGAAFAGAVLAILLVYALARVGKVLPVYTLVLAGVVVSSLAGSVLIFLAHTSIAREREFHSVMWWLLGSLQVFDGWLVAIAAVAVGGGIVAALLSARDLNALAMGEEPAAHLGLRVERTKKVMFVVASLLTGVAVATSGLIGFVGLIVPHAVRILVGPDHKLLLPLSALAGAVFLVVADILARTLLGAAELPIGVITAFLGGPFFLYLLRSRRPRRG